MTTYKGNEFKVRAKRISESGQYHAQFSLTIHKGSEVEDRGFTYLLIKGTDNRAEFESEERALEAAMNTAKRQIDEIAG